VDEIMIIFKLLFALFILIIYVGFAILVGRFCQMSNDD